MDAEQRAEDWFLTISRSYNSVLTVKGSRFVAIVSPATRPARVEQIVNQIRQKYHDATHHCYAFRLGYATDRLERFFDAGEPPGTAGRPILEALQSKEIWDVAAVVTRWFGGKKLGTGGLQRTYRAAVETALDEGTLVSQLVVSTYDLRFAHSLTGAVYKVIGEFKGLVTSTDFGSRIRLSVTVRRSDGPDFCRRLSDAGRGGIQVEHTGLGVR